MKNLLKGFVTIVSVCVVAGAYAQKPKAPATKTSAPKTMVCPSCKMKMGMKKTSAAPVAVKTKNGTFYCCAACASGKAMMKAAKPAPKKP